MNNQGSEALDLNGVSQYFNGVTPIGTFELAAIDFFSHWPESDIKELLKHVKQEDVTDILVEFSKFGQAYREINYFRVLPSSMQDQYQVELRKGRGVATDITYQAPVSRKRYLLGVHGKKR